MGVFFSSPNIVYCLYAFRITYIVSFYIVLVLDTNITFFSHISNFIRLYTIIHILRISKLHVQRKHEMKCVCAITHFPSQENCIMFTPLYTHVYDRHTLKKSRCHTYVTQYNKRDILSARFILR